MARTRTKRDLVVEVARRTGLPQGDCKLAIEAFLDAMRDILLMGERVEFRGFGVFQVKERAPKVARNPRTNEEIRLPRRKVIVFKPSRIVLEQLK